MSGKYAYWLPPGIFFILTGVTIYAQGVKIGAKGAPCAYRYAGRVQNECLCINNLTKMKGFGIGFDTKEIGNTVENIEIPVSQSILGCKNGYSIHFAFGSYHFTHATSSGVINDRTYGLTIGNNLTIVSFDCCNASLMLCHYNKNGLFRLRILYD